MARFSPPRLDDRDMQALATELRRRIPVHLREWTDHNPSDPGIAMLELFAWLGENLLQRMNRVPEAARMEFLRLLGILPKPAQAARAFIQFTLDGDDNLFLLPFGPTLPQATLEAPGAIGFQLQGEIQVLPVETLAAVKRTGPALDPAALMGGEALTDLLRDHLGEEAAPGPAHWRVYETEVLPDPVKGALPHAVDLGETVDRTLWVALLAPKRTLQRLPGAGDAEKIAGLRKSLADARAEARILNLGVRVDAELCGPDDGCACGIPGAKGNADAPVIWQVATGRFLTGSGATLLEDAPKVGFVDKARYERLKVIEDGTGAFHHSGIVRLELPRARQPGGESPFSTWTADSFDPADEGLMGIGPLPPRLADPSLEARVITWVRVFRQDPEATPPRLRWVGGNSADSRQAQSAAGEILGYGKGITGQAFTVSCLPVIPESLTVQVRHAAGFVRYTRVADLTLSGPEDPHFELDPEAGEIRFGDGVQGRAPRPGEQVRCLPYRYGGGAAGNVPAGSIARLIRPGAPPTLKASNPFPAEGGADAETLQGALRRIPESLRHRERAVAADDYRDLALETPGRRVGRAEVLPRHKVPEHVDEVPGVVTVVIVPNYDALHPDEPVPDRELLRAVCRHLDPLRPVTAELQVIPPEYVPLWVSVAVEVEEGFGEATVRRWVETTLRQTLAPLPPYGPTGAGWPFGREVRGADLEAAVLRVQGVRLVRDLKLEGPILPAPFRRIEGVVHLLKWQLPSLKGVTVGAGTEAEPIRREGDPGPEPGAGTLPVPARRETC